MPSIGVDSQDEFADAENEGGAGAQVPSLQQSGAVESSPLHREHRGATRVPDESPQEKFSMEEEGSRARSRSRYDQLERAQKVVRQARELLGICSRLSFRRSCHFTLSSYYAL